MTWKTGWKKIRGVLRRKPAARAKSTTPPPEADAVPAVEVSARTDAAAPTPWMDSLPEDMRAAVHSLFSGVDTAEALTALEAIAEDLFRLESEPADHVVAAAAICGFCHDFGIGAEADGATALRYMEQAAIFGDRASRARLVYVRKHGRAGVRIDRVEAMRWERLVSYEGEDGEAATGPESGAAGPADGAQPVDAPCAVARRNLPWLAAAADDYDQADAQFVLGVCYQDGLGVPRCAARAVAHYRRAAAPPGAASSPSDAGSAGSTLTLADLPRSVGGHAQAQGLLGFCYGQGVGVDADARRALRWYARAASQGDAVAMFNIGHCVEEGAGVRRDAAAAVRWYRRAARLGSAHAQNSLGYCYEDGAGVEADAARAAHWYGAAARQGYMWAQCNLGYCYQNGIGVPRDERRGARWYLRAARQGYARAQHNMGFCLQNGLGVRRDARAAIGWYRLAAAQGNAYAFHSLGFCLQHGIGTRRDAHAAVQWYLRAAEQDHHPAMLSLGYCYRNGIGVPRDDGQVFRWFGRCAAQGNAVAQNSLGYCHQEGVGTPRDAAAALACYARSARQGYGWAQYNLGRAYAEGLGTSPRPSDALRCFADAATGPQRIPQAAVRAGALLEAQGDAPAAQAWYARAAAAGSADGHFRLGQLHEAAGRMPQAVHAYSAAAVAGSHGAARRLRALYLESRAGWPPATALGADLGAAVLRAQRGAPLDALPVSPRGHVAPTA